MSTILRERAGHTTDRQQDVTLPALSQAEVRRRSERSRTPVEASKPSHYNTNTIFWVIRN